MLFYGYTIKLLRDHKLFAFMIGFPLLMIFILGNTVEGRIQYYSINLLFMTILIGGSLIIELEDENSRNSIHLRERCSNRSQQSLYHIKSISLSLWILLQSIVIILATKIFYQVDWGENILVVLLLGLAMAYFGVALAYFIFNIVRNQQLATGIYIMITIVNTIMGGGIIPVEQMAVDVSKYSTMHYAIKAMNLYIKNGSIKPTIFICALMLLIGTVLNNCYTTRYAV